MKNKRFNLDVYHDNFEPFYRDALETSEEIYMACDKAVSYARMQLKEPDNVDVFIEVYGDKVMPIYAGKVRIGVTRAISVYRMYTMVMDKIEEILRG